MNQRSSFHLAGKRVVMKALQGQKSDGQREDGVVKNPEAVTPAKAKVQKPLK
jgi:hypothetical protein